MEISNYVFVSDLSATRLSADDFFLVSHLEDTDYISRKVSYGDLSTTFNLNTRDYVSSVVSSYDDDIHTLKRDVKDMSADQNLVVSGLISLMECSKKVRTTLSSHTEQLSTMSAIISSDELSIMRLDDKFDELKSMAYCESSDYLPRDTRVIPGTYNQVSVDENGLVVDVFNQHYALSIALSSIDDVLNIALLGENDNIVANCDATELIKDSFLSSVKYEDGYLIFVFKKGTTRKLSTDIISVSLSNLVDIYTPGVGLTANSENPKVFDVDFSVVSTNINLSDYTLTSENEKWNATYATVSELSDSWNFEKKLSGGVQLNSGLYSITTNSYGQIIDGALVTSSDLENIGVATKQDLSTISIEPGCELANIGLYKVQTNRYGQVMSGEIVQKADLNDFGFADGNDVTTLSTDVKSMQNQINTLQNTVNNLVSSLNTIVERIEPLYELSDIKTDVSAFNMLFQTVSQLSNTVNDIMRPTTLITEQDDIE